MTTYIMHFGIRHIGLKNVAEGRTAPGVDVMITIFCDFPNFREKIGVFLKYQCYDQLFSKFSFVLSQKRQFFR
jgi:hypothetical protein